MKNPNEVWTPSSDSNALREVEALLVWEGAKAAAEPARRARTAYFIMIGFGVGNYVLFVNCETNSNKYITIVLK